jgi:amino acid adenylation domain-containing protein
MALAATFDELLDRSNLTGRQLLIYAGQLLHPGVVLYNSVYAIGWPDLEPERFRRAWQALVDSCDALRIVVEEVQGIPQQRVLPSSPTEVECVDLNVGDIARAWIERRLQSPLILTERIYDTALIRTAEKEYVWFLHIHHIVVDGAALQILIRRLTELYWDKLDRDEVEQGRSWPQFLPRATLVCEERKSQKYLADKAYWVGMLKDAPSPPPFYGVDAFRRTAQERVILTLEQPTSATITTLARSLATPSMSEHAIAANLFNAAFAAYLSRVSGTEQVSIGVTFHNRSSEEDRQTIGLFMEVFPIALRVGPEDTLVTLMRQVATSTAEALKHRIYSVGHSARAPAFSGLFNYMRALTKPLGTLDVRRVHPGQGSNAISLSVEPRGDTFDLWFDLNADVAATSSAQRVAEHLRTFLEAATLNPERPLAQLPLLSSWETKEVLALSSGPNVAFAGCGAGCHRAFETRVAGAPHSVALSCGEVELTYTELNQRANRLAHRLLSLGGKRGRRVGICLERSPQMIVAVLAVLKSGAAYVPLDPSYPQGRLRMMLEDAAPAVLITTQQIAGSLPLNAARPLYMEQESIDTDLPDNNPEVDVVPSDIAYVIYTSGSTGTPKGVLVTHGNVSNHLAWRTSYFPIQPADRCLQTASLSFDDSVWEMLEPLSAGARVVLTRPRFEYDSTYLVRLMVEQQVTVACFVPSLLREIIESPEIGACVALRRLTTGGEGLSIPLQRRVLERMPQVAFFNGYGTTEATIASVYWRCLEVPGQSVVPIGRPIANTQVYILDRSGQLVPPGVLGEICIAGVGVARGYLDRPQLTAERFVEDRFGKIPGARLYRTGDLGRLRSDGVLEFAGRLDDQIKIRGIRVELGDIEAAILDHPQVRSAAVICSDTPSGKRLTAYVVPRGATPVATAELRSFVRDRIPPALIPNRFESIATLPLTPNGKLDRRALQPRLDPEETSEHLVPRNDLERRLVALWEGVLQARPIGIRDDFFELGGHSLSAVQLAAAVGRMAGRSVSPGLLFEAPTIEMLSSRLASAANNAVALVPLARGGAGTPLFLLHHVSGDITAYRDLANYLGEARTIYGIRMPELDTNETPLDRIEAMASRYISEIQQIQANGPYLLGGHSAGAHIAYEMARQLRAAGEQVALLAILEADARGSQGRLSDNLRHQLSSVGRIPKGQRVSYVWRKLTGWVDNRRAPRRTFVSTMAGNNTKNPVWIAMERAVRAYQPLAYEGAVTLFRATDRSVTGTYSRTLGWERLARGGVRVIDVPGTHSTVLRPGSEPPMAAKLRACLEEVTARERAGNL